jgi:hypothetical protein
MVVRVTFTWWLGESGDVKMHFLQIGSFCLQRTHMILVPRTSKGYRLYSDVVRYGTYLTNTKVIRTNVESNNSVESRLCYIPKSYQRNTAINFDVPKQKRHTSFFVKTRKQVRIEQHENINKKYRFHTHTDNADEPTIGKIVEPNIGKTIADVISAQIQIRCKRLTKIMETIHSLSKLNRFPRLLQDAQFLLSQTIDVKL